MAIKDVHHDGCNLTTHKWLRAPADKRACSSLHHQCPMGTAEAKNEIKFSFSTMVIRVAELQEALSTSKEARCSLEGQCASLQGQLDNARADIESYKNKFHVLLKHTKEKEAQLHDQVIRHDARHSALRRKASMHESAFCRKNVSRFICNWASSGRHCAHLHSAF